MTPKLAEKSDKALKELEERTKLPQDELMKKIEEKQAAFGHMLTVEGAAHLVAKDLGVKLFNENAKRLEIKNIVPGMHSVSFAGKIFKISGIVDFARSGKAGKVVNLFIGDATGYVRLPLWNDHVKLVEDEEIKVGDTMKVMNAMAREGMFGIELVLGKYGRLAPLDEEMDIELPDADELNKRYLSEEGRDERVEIKDAVPGSFELRAFIVQVFNGSFIFNTCPECGGRLEESSGKFTCSMHGEVEPEPALVASAIADDGTADMRVTFFRNAVEQLCGISAQEIVKMQREERYMAIAGRTLGKEFLLEGRVQKNQRFERTEMIVSSVEQLNIYNETEKIIDAIEGEMRV